MNRLYIDGMIASEPIFKMEPGEVPHLTFRLGVRHKTRSGETRFEYYRVSAWHKTALWAQDRLRRGQLVSVAGYLTQRTVQRAEETLADSSSSKEDKRLAQAARRRAQVRLSIPKN